MILAVMAVMAPLTLIAIVARQGTLWLMVSALIPVMMVLWLSMEPVDVRATAKHANLFLLAVLLALTPLINFTIPNA